jgi:uncharacterized protein YndB with AHSA1/START domain
MRALAGVGAMALLTIAAAPAGGEVTARALEGFVVRHELILAAGPEAAYRALVEDVALWWNADHSYSGAAGNLSIDGRAGGCFCEALPGGGSVEHMRVVFAQPGRLLRLAGGLGPLQGMGAGGVMDFAFEPVEAGGTRLRFSYTVGGFAPGGLDGMADPVDGVLADQLGRLQRHLAGAGSD